jgi:predicted secreted protein
MKRGKKIIVVSHCYLNQNARVRPYASMPGAFKELIIPLIEADFGIIQLPCPETTGCGLNRWEAVTEQYDNPGFRRHCRSILQPYVDQLTEHAKAGDDIRGVLGVPFSPCCGAEHNPSQKNWGGPVTGVEVKPLEIVDGPAIFMQEMMDMCEKAGLSLSFSDVSEDPSSFPDAQPYRILGKVQSPSR